VLATNGYFPHGYGIKAKGMAGASVAMAEDSLGGANNPASVGLVGSRVDVGLEYFSPHRDASRSGAGFPTLNGSVESDKTSFLIPEFGYTRTIDKRLSWGLTVYGNGGMNTTYPQGSFNCGGPPANMLCGSGTLGVDLMQLVLAPTLAFRFDEQHAVGISLLLGYQRFEAKGLQAFDNAPGFPPFTSAPGKVTNNGYDTSTGVGVRLGYLGRFGDLLSVGISYAPKMNMSRFDKYAGLFADQGDFDFPENYALGIALRPAHGITLALDFERINYGGVGAVGNPSTVQLPLGASGGPGFGWEAIDVVKFGVQWKVDSALTLRGGINHGDNPVTASNVTFNIVAPGVMTTHYTLGFSFATSPSDEISGFAMTAPRQSVSGSSLFNNLLGAGAGGTETISMRQYSFGFAWSRKF
jgi:long-chain fatty acid transport protein